MRPQRRQVGGHRADCGVDTEHDERDRGAAEPERPGVEPGRHMLTRREGADTSEHAADQGGQDAAVDGRGTGTAPPAGWIGGPGSAGGGVDEGEQDRPRCVEQEVVSR